MKGSYGVSRGTSYTKQQQRQFVQQQLPTAIAVYRSPDENLPLVEFCGKGTAFCAARMSDLLFFSAPPGFTRPGERPLLCLKILPNVFLLVPVELARVSPFLNAFVAYTEPLAHTKAYTVLDGVYTQSFCSTDGTQFALELGRFLAFAYSFLHRGAYAAADTQLLDTLIPMWEYVQFFGCEKLTNAVVMQANAVLSRPYSVGTTIDPSVLIPMMSHVGKWGPHIPFSHLAHWRPDDFFKLHKVCPLSDDAIRAMIELSMALKPAVTTHGKNSRRLTTARLVVLYDRPSSGPTHLVAASRSHRSVGSVELRPDENPIGKGTAGDVYQRQIFPNPLTHCCAPGTLPADTKLCVITTPEEDDEGGTLALDPALLAAIAPNAEQRAELVGRLALLMKVVDPYVLRELIANIGMYLLAQHPTHTFMDMSAMTLSIVNAVFRQDAYLQDWYEAALKALEDQSLTFDQARVLFAAMNRQTREELRALIARYVATCLSYKQFKKLPSGYSLDVLCELLWKNNDPDAKPSAKRKRAIAPGSADDLIFDDIDGIFDSGDLDTDSDGDYE